MSRTRKNALKTHCFSCLSFKVPRKLNTAGYVAEIGGNQFTVHMTVTRVLLKKQSEMSPSILLYKHLECHGPQSICHFHQPTLTSLHNKRYMFSLNSYSQWTRTILTDDKLEVGDAYVELHKLHFFIVVGSATMREYSLLQYVLGQIITEVGKDHAVPDCPLNEGKRLQTKISLLPRKGGRKLKFHWTELPIL